MINFRFHVVSIVAAFLALAVGVVFGSTIVDQAIVDGLRADLGHTRRGIAEARDQNEELKSDIDRFDSYSESMAPFVVEGRLEGDGVVLLAERGLDEKLIDSELELLAASGATSVVLVWLEPKLIAEPESLGRLQEIVNSADEDPNVIRRQSFGVIADYMNATSLPGATDQTSATAVGAQVDGRARLLSDERFITIEGDVDALVNAPVAERRAIVIGSLQADAGRIDMLADIAGAFDNAGFETVVGEATPAISGDIELPDRGARVIAVTSGPLAAGVATVDNVDELQGRVALVLAVAEVIHGVVGHYGFGVGATRSSPTWSNG